MANRNLYFFAKSNEFERSSLFMKKSTLIIIGVVAVVVILIGSLIGTYNGLVESKEAATEKQSEISNQLQRRADLIPNFVETVKGYSDYEKETYLAVTEARAAVKKADSVGEQADASAQLDGAIDVWVNAVTEAYPELKASENYKALQDELAGTENRIAVARGKYNTSAKEYNVKIKKFPSSIIAGMFGFESLEYFEADEGAEKVPQVSFD